MVIIPVTGGLIAGFMARYGPEKIRGHGIPETIEAILFGDCFKDARLANRNQEGGNAALTRDIEHPIHDPTGCGSHAHWMPGYFVQTEIVVSKYVPAVLSFPARIIIARNRCRSVRRIQIRRHPLQSDDRERTITGSWR